jgi:hypothetical protein
MVVKRTSDEKLAGALGFTSEDFDESDEEEDEKANERQRRRKEAETRGVMLDLYSNSREDVKEETIRKRLMGVGSGVKLEKVDFTDCKNLETAQKELENKEWSAILDAAQRCERAWAAFGSSERAPSEVESAWIKAQDDLDTKFRSTAKAVKEASWPKDSSSRDDAEEKLQLVIGEYLATVDAWASLNKGVREQVSTMRCLHQALADRSTDKSRGRNRTGGRSRSRVPRLTLLDLQKSDHDGIDAPSSDGLEGESQHGLGIFGATLEPPKSPMLGTLTGKFSRRGSDVVQTASPRSRSRFRSAFSRRGSSEAVMTAETEIRQRTQEAHDKLEQTFKSMDDLYTKVDTTLSSRTKAANSEEGINWENIRREFLEASQHLTSEHSK